MERLEILKSIGFSDKFLTALTEYENETPNIYYELPFNESEYKINVADSSDQIIVNSYNTSYSTGIVVSDGEKQLKV